MPLKLISYSKARCKKIWCWEMIFQTLTSPRGGCTPIAIVQWCTIKALVYFFSWRLQMLRSLYLLSKPVYSAQFEKISISIWINNIWTEGKAVETFLITHTFSNQMCVCVWQFSFQFYLHLIKDSTWCQSYLSDNLEVKLGVMSCSGKGLFTYDVSHQSGEGWFGKCWLFLIKGVREVL